MDTTRQRFQMALGLTFLGLVFAVPALLGCDLHKSNDSFVACAPWSDSVLWSRVWIGAPILLVAGLVWIRSPSQRVGAGEPHFREFEPSQDSALRIRTLRQLA